MTDDWTRYVGAELYSELGRALSQWQNVEVGLYHVFLCVTQMPNQLIASAVFFSPINFRDKLTMVDSAASFALADTPHMEKWKRLAKKAGQKSLKRNELAHFMAIHSGNPKNPGSLLRPNIFNAKAALYWAKKGRLPEYTPKQLREKAQSFGRLSEDLEKFAEGLRGLTLPSPDIHPL